MKHNQDETAMSNQFQDFFNYAFGSNITHVANGYSRRDGDFLLVAFHEEELTLTQLKLSVSVKDYAKAEAALINADKTATVGLVEMQHSLRCASATRK